MGSGFVFLRRSAFHIFWQTSVKLSIKISSILIVSVGLHLCTLRAEATFALCELSCEKKPLPTTVQIPPEIWTNKFLKNRVFSVLDRFRVLRESCASLA